VKPNLPVLGRTYGAGVATIRQGLAARPAVAVAELVRRGQTVPVEGFDLEAEDILLEAKDHEGFAVAVDSGYAVAVATTITPELADEGLAREIVRRIQDMRRDAGFDLSDRITTWCTGDGDVARVMQSQSAYIQGETLSTELLAGAPPADAFSVERISRIGGHPCRPEERLSGARYAAAMTGRSWILVGLAAFVLALPASPAAEVIPGAGANDSADSHARRDPRRRADR
jgi:hypothetical protein